MIESPLIQELLAERRHEDILLFLEGRFGPVPGDIKPAVQAIQDELQLRELLLWASRCSDLEAFRSRLNP